MYGVICGPRVYEYKGWVFEYHTTSVWPLRNSMERRKRAGKVFYEMIGEFSQLPKETQEQYRVGGGCVAF